MKEFEETDNEIIEELQENISELENTIEDLTDNIDDLPYQYEDFPPGFWRKLAKEVNYIHITGDYKNAEA
jgi:vacuolar-type H+-ATPase subunit I/STV1